MTPRLPGLPTISVLMLAAILTVWLGLSGPVDLSTLKEWQTLSAAFVALAAAGIAYLAAMGRSSVHQGEQRQRMALGGRGSGMTPRLPGLPTISALMLAAILTVWLGLSGPVDLSKLKEWQALSATFVALAAAGIAYLAVMAKVNRSIHQGEQLRQIQSIPIKVRYAALIFRTKLNGTLKRLQPPIGCKPDGIMAKDISILWPPEFQEAWQNLDIFGAPAAEAIANIIYNRDLLDDAVAHLDATQQFQYNWLAIPGEIRAIIKLMKEIDTFIEDLLRSLPNLQAEGLNAMSCERHFIPGPPATPALARPGAARSSP
jgi:surface antigen